MPRIRLRQRRWNGHECARTPLLRDQSAESRSRMANCLLLVTPAVFFLMFHFNLKILDEVIRRVFIIASPADPLPQVVAVIIQANVEVIVDCQLVNLLKTLRDGWKVGKMLSEFLQNR